MAGDDRRDGIMTRARIFGLTMAAGLHLVFCFVMFGAMLSPSDDLWNLVCGVSWVSALGAGLGWLCAEVCWAFVMEVPGHQPGPLDRLRAMAAGAALGLACLAIAPIALIACGPWMIPPLMLTEGVGAGAALGVVVRIWRQHTLAFIGAQLMVILPVTAAFFGPLLLLSALMLIDSRNPYSSGRGPAPGDIGVFLVILLIGAGLLAILAIAVFYSVLALGKIYSRFGPRVSAVAEEAPRRGLL